MVGEKVWDEADQSCFLSTPIWAAPFFFLSIFVTYRLCGRESQSMRKNDLADSEKADKMIVPSCRSMLQSFGRLSFNLKSQRLDAHSLSEYVSLESSHEGKKKTLTPLPCCL